MAEGRGERTIGSGHLVALFLGIVVLCCVFFILGYEMGRAQFEKGGSATAAAKPATPAPAAPTKEETPSTGWPSGPSGAGSSPAQPSVPAGSAPTATAGKAPAGASGAAHGAVSGSLKAPEIPGGAYVLQVSAHRNESEALNLAKLLQDKGFPAFVLTPSTDEWYRVRVGPYADMKSAEQAKAALVREGFKPLLKH